MTEAEKVKVTSIGVHIPEDGKTVIVACEAPDRDPKDLLLMMDRATFLYACSVAGRKLKLRPKRSAQRS